MSLVIDGIDPEYTLGDLEAKKREIRERLQREGLFDANKRLPPPWTTTRCWWWHRRRRLVWRFPRRGRAFAGFRYLRVRLWPAVSRAKERRPIFVRRF
ncbi:hypothetical protein ACVBEH_00825 [Roseateles sp. GG27B]